MNIRFKRSYVTFGLSSLLSGCLFGLTLLLTCLSFAALIYVGELRPFLPIGFSLILLGSVMTVMVVPFLSGRATTLTEPLIDALPMYVLLSSALAATFATRHLQSALLLTVLVAIFISTLLTALVFLLIGLFKKANLVSFLPYPVMTGFFAGIGWLLFSDSLLMLTKLHLTYASIPGFFEPSVMIKYVPALIFGFLLYLCELKNLRIHYYLAVVVLAVLLFYGVEVAWLHTPLATLQANDLLLHSVPHARLADYHSLLLFQGIHWHAILDNTSAILLVVFFSITGLLIKLSGLDILLKTETNINRELRIAGGVNIVTAFLGSLVSYTGINITMLNDQDQPKDAPTPYLVCIITGLFCIVTFFYGLPLLKYLPRFVLGSILIFFGLSFLKKGIYDTYKKMAKQEYIIILLILGVVIHYGIFQGVALGIIISITIFAITYSRLNVIGHIFTGKSIVSNKQREQNVHKWLIDHGKYLLYIKIQNYLFFGNAQTLWHEVKQRISQDSPNLRYVIFGFHELVGIDSSAMTIFIKLKQLAKKEKFTLIFIEVDKNVLELMKRNGVISGNKNFIKTFSTYDEALQWCEDAYLRLNHLTSRASIPLEVKLKELQDDVDTSKLHLYFEKFALKKGEYLFRTNDPTGPVYYIESGYLNIFWDANQDEIKQLRTIGPGNTIGEYGFYLKRPRPATIIAAEDCVIQALSHESRARMYQHASGLMMAFDMLIVSNLNERIVYSWGRQSAYM